MGGPFELSLAIDYAFGLSLALGPNEQSLHNDVSQWSHAGSPPLFLNQEEETCHHSVILELLWTGPPASPSSSRHRNPIYTYGWRIPLANCETIYVYIYKLRTVGDLVQVHQALTTHYTSTELSACYVLEHSLTSMVTMLFTFE
jgi:hypothetical protein